MIHSTMKQKHIELKLNRMTLLIRYALHEHYGVEYLYAR